MEPKDQDLLLSALRTANRARIPLFKNGRGEIAHPMPDGSDWNLSAWSNAVLGELGEAANMIKKVERGDMTLDEARPALAKEFADVLCYLDILAFRAGVNLGAATISKFNEISIRVGAPIRLSTRHAYTIHTGKDLEDDDLPPYTVGNLSK